MNLQEHPSLKKVWAVVKRIPKGCVSTYAQVASEAGFHGHARLAGWALRHAPPKLKLPWHRVINAQGKISLPAGSEGAREQKKRLEAEGVKFVKGRVSLAQYRWRPRSELPLLD